MISKREALKKEKLLVANIESRNLLQDILREERLRAQGIEKKRQAKMAPLLEKLEAMNIQFTSPKSSEISDFLKDIDLDFDYTSPTSEFTFVKDKEGRMRVFLGKNPHTWKELYFHGDEVKIEGSPKAIDKKNKATFQLFEGKDPDKLEGTKQEIDVAKRDYINAYEGRSTVADNVKQLAADLDFGTVPDRKVEDWLGTTRKPEEEYNDFIHNYLPAILKSESLSRREIIDFTADDYGHQRPKFDFHFDNPQLEDEGEIFERRMNVMRRYASYDDQKAEDALDLNMKLFITQKNVINYLQANYPTIYRQIASKYFEQYYPDSESHNEGTPVGTFQYSDEKPIDRRVVAGLYRSILSRSVDEARNRFPYFSDSLMNLEALSKEKKALHDDLLDSSNYESSRPGSTVSSATTTTTMRAREIDRQAEEDAEAVRQAEEEALEKWLPAGAVAIDTSFIPIPVMEQGGRKFTVYYDPKTDHHTEQLNEHVSETHVVPRGNLSIGQVKYVRRQIDAMKKQGRGIKEEPEVIIIPDNKKDLLDRLKLLVSAKHAGHSNVENEKKAILQRLLSKRWITEKEYKKLNKVKLRI